ncbi:hypothetical protein ACWF94_10985, partial [Streptomyces sp. NPDC055078]
RLSGVMSGTRLPIDGHTARVARIATLTLDDVDLGNRWLTVAGRARPLDDLLKLLTDWLDHRRHRWPSTANLHLLINNQTANATGRAGNHWISAPMRGQDATLERLRVDRQLEGALTHGPDPLHHAEVFGLDERPRCATRTPHGPCWDRPPPRPAQRVDREPTGSTVRIRESTRGFAVKNLQFPYTHA